MNPEDTSLAHLLVALPGFPKFDEIGGVHDVGDSDEGAPIWYANGLIWVGVDLVHGEWVRVPLLTHMGTAGILLGMLWAADPDAGWHVHGPPGLVCVHRADGSDEHYGDHLGVAVARALLAVGRCA